MGMAGKHSLLFLSNSVFKVFIVTVALSVGLFYLGMYPIIGKAWMEYTWPLLIFYMKDCPAHATRPSVWASKESCKCDVGFQGIALDCRDIDECTEFGYNPCFPHGDECTNLEGSFLCECFQGYQFNGKTCIDIDECWIPTPCGEGGDCENLPGSYQCHCFPGWKTTPTTCLDIDECAEDICGIRGKCTNYPGKYICDCYDGFDKSLRNCPDINECKDPDNNPCNPGGKCVNYIGSYGCKCEFGWLLKFKGDFKYYCEDYDECADVDDAICGNFGICTNTPGSYGCFCLEGYKDTRRGYCQDEIECNRVPMPCNIDGGICFNTPGSYGCTCFEGFINVGTSCVDENECLGDTPVCNSPYECQNQIGTFTCVCEKGYTMLGSYCHEDLPKCYYCASIIDGWTVGSCDPTIFINCRYKINSVERETERHQGVLLATDTVLGIESEEYRTFAIEYCYVGDGINSFSITSIQPHYSVKNGFILRLGAVYHAVGGKPQTQSRRIPNTQCSIEGIVAPGTVTKPTNIAKQPKVRLPRVFPDLKCMNGPIWLDLESKFTCTWIYWDITEKTHLSWFKSAEELDYQRFNLLLSLDTDRPYRPPSFLFIETENHTLRLLAIRISKFQWSSAVPVFRTPATLPQSPRTEKYIYVY